MNTTNNIPNNHPTTALLVIDVQQGLFEVGEIYRADSLLENINLLVDRAHNASAPVIYIQHSGKRHLLNGTPGWRFHPQIRPTKKDSIVHKEQGNAFEGTNLDALLKTKQVSQVVICGLITHGCVRATCVGTLKMGYKVILVTDAHSNYSPRAAEIIDALHEKMRCKNAALKKTADTLFQ